MMYAVSGNLSCQELWTAPFPVLQMTRVYGNEEKQGVLNDLENSRLNLNNKQIYSIWISETYDL